MKRPASAAKSKGTRYIRGEKEPCEGNEFHVNLRVAGRSGKTAIASLSKKGKGEERMSAYRELNAHFL